MEASEALAVVRALAEGRDPASGAPLARARVFQQPQVIRALFTAATALEHAASKPAAGGAWSSEEERKLVEQFDAGVSPADIAHEHGRTRGAIVSRLVKLGKITKSDEPIAAAAKPTTIARVKPDDGIPF